MTDITVKEYNCKLKVAESIRVIDTDYKNKKEKKT